MSEHNQNQGETTLKTSVIDENGKEVELLGDNFTPYQFKPLVVSAWKLPYMVQVTTPDGEMIGDIGDWLVIGVGGWHYICKSDIFDLHYSPVTSPPETAPPATAPPEADLPKTDLPDNEAPLLQWKVKVHCVISFEPDILLTAWKTRLPNVALILDFRASTGNKSIFDVVVGIEASSNAGACSMASGLLKRHFQTIEILDMGADPV